MGSCASAQRKLRRSIVHSETEKNPNLMPSESVMEKAEIVVVGVIDQQPSRISNGHTSRVSPFNSVSSFSNYGSKEEAFFDTQGWLESDCDDEFYSVNGDFTPSLGNTPLYRSIPGTPLNRSLSSQVNRALLEGRSPPNFAAGAESNKSSRVSTPVRRSVSTSTPRLDSEVVPQTEPKKKSKKLGDLFRESFRERQSEESPNSDSYISAAESQPEIAENKEKNLKHAQGCLPRIYSARFLRKSMAPQVAVDA